MGVQDISEMSNCLNKTQQKILKVVSKKELRSSNDYLYALASLGGHIKYNGRPGWITLNKGMKELLVIERGWKLASLKT